MNKKDVELEEFDLEKMLSEINSTPKWLRIWWGIEDFFVNMLSPKRWYRRIKYFLQRLIRGFDDSETWELDDTFLKWLLPRLKRFNELNYGYPEDRGSFENWKNEINQKIIQLETILNSDEWYSKDYENEIEDFLNWFKNNIRHLWW